MKRKQSIQFFSDNVAWLNDGYVFKNQIAELNAKCKYVYTAFAMFAR